jgi:hypothetical protein
MGLVTQVVDGADSALQGVPDELGHSFQLRVEHYFQMVVTIYISKCFSKVFICLSSRGAM